MPYLVAFWNLENLFAPEGFPGREPWLANAVQNDPRGLDRGPIRPEGRAVRLNHRLG